MEKRSTTEIENATPVDFFGSIVPPEVTHAILSYLSPLDVVSASQVSKIFAGLLDSRGIWKRIVEEQFGPLDEQIFKGNIINWKRTFSHCSELQKWKKHFLGGQVVNQTNELLNHYITTANKMALMQKVSGTGNSFTFYRDKAKKKPFACLNCTGDRFELLGYSVKYALMRFGGQVQLWDLTVDCKHTDEHKWKSALNKAEVCKKKCSFVRDLAAEARITECYWNEVPCSVLYMTAESIVTIDLNTGEESSCQLPIEKYGDKRKPVFPLYSNFSKFERIREVRVQNVNGVSMTFCHVSSVNGEFFVNLTTKRIHLFIDKACNVVWISKSLKVAVFNEKRDQMRVVNIAEEQPKILAKLYFDKRMSGVVSSPEGHVLFVWHFDLMSGIPYIRAYLWEIGYLLGEISPEFNYRTPHSYRPRSSCWRTDEPSGKHQFLIESMGVAFNKIKL